MQACRAGSTQAALCLPSPPVAHASPHCRPPPRRSGKYDGPEAERLAVLRLAALSGAAYVDVELKIAPVFFAAEGAVPASTKVIVSSHDYERTASEEELQELVEVRRAAL